MALEGSTLDTLAQRINEEHDGVVRGLRATLDHARQAGALLLEAKSRCAHGEWLAWLDTNISFGQRMAQNYMRLAEHWPELETRAPNAQSVASLGVGEALKLLAAPQDKAPSPAPTLEEQEAKIEAALERTRELRAHLQVCREGFHSLRLRGGAQALEYATFDDFLTGEFGHLSHVEVELFRQWSHGREEPGALWRVIELKMAQAEGRAA